MEKIAFVINEIRGNIKKMIRNDVITNIIHHIIPYIQKYYF